MILFKVSQLVVWMALPLAQKPGQAKSNRLASDWLWPSPDFRKAKHTMTFILIFFIFIVAQHSLRENVADVNNLDHEYVSVRATERAWRAIL